MAFMSSDPITCVAGHEQGRFLRDGRKGEPITGEDFAILSGQPGDQGYTCDQVGCGEPVAVQMEEGHWCVHTPTGWVV
jgi:hypothetical protein